MTKNKDKEKANVDVAGQPEQPVEVKPTAEHPPVDFEQTSNAAKQKFLAKQKGVKP